MLIEQNTRDLRPLLDTLEDPRQRELARDGVHGWMYKACLGNASRNATQLGRRTIIKAWSQVVVSRPSAQIICPWVRYRDNTTAVSYVTSNICD